MEQTRQMDKITECDKQIITWYSKLSIQAKVTFYSTFIIGCFTHLYFLMHKFTNEDDIMGLTATVDFTGLGRWFADDVASIRTEYKIPFVIGILCILYICVAAVALVDTLEIKSLISCSLIGGLLITFPTVSYTLGYLVSADGGAFAIMLAVLAVWSTLRFKRGYIWGAILLCLSLGTYYAYMGMAIGISLLIILKLCLSKDNGLKGIMGIVSKLLVMGIGGVSLYFIVTKITLTISNTTLPNYKGLDSMGKIPLEQIPNLLHKTYLNFFRFFDSHYIYISKLTKISLVVTALITVGMLVAIVVRLKLHKKYLNLMIILLCIVAIPLGINIVDFIAPESGTYTLTLYPFVLIFILPIMIIDISQNLRMRDKKKKEVAIWVSFVACILIMFQFYLLNNIYYIKADVFYQRTYGIHNRILSRVEEKAEFSQGAPVAIVGLLPNLNYPNGTEMFPIIYNDYGLGSQYIGVAGNGNNVIYNSQEFAMFCNQFLGVPINSVTQEQFDSIKSNEKFKDMPIWPEEGCIQVIDGVIVVNMNYNLNIDVEKSDGNKYIFKHKFANTMPENTQYAWYLYKDGQQIETKWYTEEPYFEYELEEKGQYQVLMFVARDQVEIGQSYSDLVYIE